MKINKDWVLDKEIYAISDLNDQYIALIVTIYQDSQFYIIFNQRKYLPVSKKSKGLDLLIKKGKLLRELVKEAEKELNFKIQKISYNLPVDKIKIVPHSHFYQFRQPTILTPKKLKEVNNKFLKDYEKDSDYQNFLFRINQYGLLDEKEV